jgi:hypothetical protein
MKGLGKEEEEKKKEEEVRRERALRCKANMAKSPGHVQMLTISIFLHPPLEQLGFQVCIITHPLFLSIKICKPLIYWQTLVLSLLLFCKKISLLSL